MNTLNLSLLVNSCDKYEFLWKQFFTLFDKYWDHTVNIPKYFLTENKPTNRGGFIDITNGQMQWTQKVLSALSKIQTDYVLWLQDDYFLRRTVFRYQFEQYLDFILQYNVDRFGIHENSQFYSLSSNISPYYRFNQYSYYTISMQASIWKKSFFQTQLSQKLENIWQFEVDGSQRLNTQKHNIYIHIQDPVWYKEAMRKGEYTQDYFNICQQENL